MSYYHHQPPMYPPNIPPSNYGIPPPLQPHLPSFLSASPSYSPYGPSYPAFAPHQQTYPGQHYGPAASNYYNHATSYTGYPGPTSAPYGGHAYPAPGAAGPAGYVQPQYTHPITPGVQLDAYGLPYVMGDVSLQYAQTFRVEEKVLSATHDSFVVRDHQGMVRYRVDGSFTIHERKSLRDMHGRTLLKLREARLKMRDRITIFSPADVPVMTLQKTSAIQVGTKRVHGYVGGHIRPNPDLIITGNQNNTYFKIVTAQGNDIAEVRRFKYTMKNVFTGQDSYEVTVQAGSPALVCFLAVVLDEIYED